MSIIHLNNSLIVCIYKSKLVTLQMCYYVYHKERMKNKEQIEDKNEVESSNDRPELPLFKALIPIVVLIALLFYNVFYAFKDDALSGSNQFILLIGATVAGIVGYTNNTSYRSMMREVANNIKSTTSQ